jgi:dual-specificity kinase
MSTPTTATATLPHYHPHHYPPAYSHSHTHHPAYQPNPNANYRSAAGATSLLPPVVSSVASPSTTAVARLPPAYPPSSVAYSSPASNGVAVSQASVSRPLPPPHNLSPRHDASYSAATMPEPASAEPSRKRRRSREPDWNTFYKNGLPKEIIVIDDTPEPEANTGRKITNGVAPGPSDSTSTRQAAKKRRRDDDTGTVQASGYHIKYIGSQNNTPLHTSTPTGSTISSSDRTNSALNTTAPTSLSSNSQYDDVQVPVKRKRTRQQVANEAKRRDIDGLGDPFYTYKPPPYPPKKSGEVNVRVVHDVSCLSTFRSA